MFTSICIAATGAAMLCYSLYSNLIGRRVDKTCLVVGLWLSVEILSDLLTLGFNQYADAAESVTYYFALAAASLIFMYETLIRGDYAKTIQRCFTLITIICVLMAFYRWFVQSRWVDGGAEFYYSYGIMLDSAFVFSILAMDSLMIILGVYSALATSNNSNNSICSKQR